MGGFLRFFLAETYRKATNDTKRKIPHSGGLLFSIFTAYTADNFGATAFIPDTRIDAAGNRKRFFHLTRNALPFLFMRQATKHEIRWMAETVRKLY